MIDVRENSVEVIRIAEKTYKDHQYVDIRQWVTGDDEELVPTRKGVRFRKELVQEMIDALQSVLGSKGSAHNCPVTRAAVCRSVASTTPMDSCSSIPITTTPPGDTLLCRATMSTVLPTTRTGRGRIGENENGRQRGPPSPVSRTGSKETLRRRDLVYRDAKTAHRLPPLP